LERGHALAGRLVVVVLLGLGGCLFEGEVGFAGLVGLGGAVGGAAAVGEERHFLRRLFLHQQPVAFILLRTLRNLRRLQIRTKSMPSRHLLLQLAHEVLLEQQGHTVLDPFDEERVEFSDIILTFDVEYGTDHALSSHHYGAYF
jgi:hypothetical protein